jgi:uncharacterized membrane protein YvbJ
LTYYLLKDPANHHQRLIRDDHISAVEINNEDHVVTLMLLGGQNVKLTPEESKQFIKAIKAHMPSSPT